MVAWVQGRNTKTECHMWGKPPLSSCQELEADLSSRTDNLPIVLVLYPVTCPFSQASPLNFRLKMSIFRAKPSHNEFKLPILLFEKYFKINASWFRLFFLSFVLCFFFAKEKIFGQWLILWVTFGSLLKRGSTVY